MVSVRRQWMDGVVSLPSPLLVTPWSLPEPLPGLLSPCSFPVCGELQSQIIGISEKRQKFTRVSPSQPELHIARLLHAHTTRVLPQESP